MFRFSKLRRRVEYSWEKQHSSTKISHLFSFQINKATRYLRSSKQKAASPFQQCFLATTSHAATFYSQLPYLVYHALFISVLAERC